MIRNRLALAVGVVLSLAAGTVLAESAAPAAGDASAAAPAQDKTQAPWVELAEAKAPDIDHGKYVFKTKANCVYCHGWPGDGKTGKYPRSPGHAANLRETQLGTNDLIQIVSCGIPGTPMPYHDRSAYKDKRCYGQTMADFEGGTPPSAGHFLSDQDIIDVVGYVEEKIKGRGPITKAECEEFFKPGASACRSFK